MNIEIPKTRNDLISYFMKEREDSQNLRNEMNFDLGEKKIDTIRERRTFLQNIALASATVLGLASVFSTLGDNNLYFPYLYIGLSFHLFVICLVFIHVSEVIDSEIDSLSEAQDRYSEIINAKIKLVEAFMGDVMKEKDDSTTMSLLSRFHEQVQELPAGQDLRKENEKLTKNRKSRLAGNKEMEFNGEVIIFVFIVGALFIMLAIMGDKLQCAQLSILILIIFWFTFSKVLSRILKILFKILTFLRKDIKNLTLTKK